MSELTAKGNGLDSHRVWVRKIWTPQMWGYGFDQTWELWTHENEVNHRVRGDLDVSGVDEWLRVGPGRANVGEQPRNNLWVEKGERPRVENRGGGENASDVREGPGVVGVNIGESTEEERYRRLLLDFDFNWGSRDTGVTIEEHSMDC